MADPMTDGDLTPEHKAEVLAERKKEYETDIRMYKNDGFSYDPKNRNRLVSESDPEMYYDLDPDNFQITASPKVNEMIDSFGGDKEKKAD